MRSRISILKLLFSVVLVSAACGGEPGMVFIPAGEFQRGRTHKLPDDGLQWYPEVMKDDRPVRAVYVDAFYMDQYEVTNEEYAKFVTATKHRAPYNWPQGKVEAGKEKLPAVAVSWDDAAAYAKWAGKRLPTEAEWERACRGLSEGKKYPWGERKATTKDARFNGIDGPAKVGSCAANEFGLFDMAGNAWEWVSDWYDRDYYASAPRENPKGPPEGRYKVMRGGSWADVDKYLTCAYRSWARAGERSPNIGFRCVKAMTSPINKR